jgi:hypothetical protein
MDFGRHTFLVCALVLAMSASATAQEADREEPSNVFAVRASIKAGALVFKAPEAPDLFPERSGAEAVWRLRVEPQVRFGANLLFTMAYEHKLRYMSSTEGLTGTGILPSQAKAPYRLGALDWSLIESSGASWRHEIDRASAQLHVRRADITIGRQAIGWGRGVMFGAVDLFAPFSPLEADREWRRGVDAIRADIKLSDRSSVDVVGAFGTAWNRSIAAARVRGFAGPVDLEVVGGRRAEDWFGGVTTSAAVGDAELHGELAAFDVPSGDEESTVVWKAVVGGSYRWPIGSGILSYAEYHYSGFGAPRAEDILVLAGTPRFSERYLRGDMQILSRHALALTASYEASPEFTYSTQWLLSPRDRSGIAVLGMTYTLNDDASLLGTGYLPYGRTPRGRTLRSEFGSASLSVLLQLRIYL